MTLSDPTPPADEPARTTTTTASRAALRAYLLGLIAAVLGAAIPIVQASLGDVRWSAAWFEALAVAVLVPAFTAASAYVAHTKFPPA